MFSFRTFLPRVAITLLACALIPSFASAQETSSREIWKAGNMSVTVIQDLAGEMEASNFSGPASKKERLKHFTNGKAEAGVSAFLLRVGDKTVLFDAGAGAAGWAPAKLPETLARLGVKPEDIDFVLLTHMHWDHIGGLLQEEKRAFPKAKVLVTKVEFDSWMALAEKDPSDKSAILVKAVAAAYGADIQYLTFDSAPLPGVTALDASGHTPGHTAFQLTADGKTLLLVGDLIHAMPLQFALPDECATFDMDKPKAIAARKRIFELAAKNGMQIAGVHFPFANAVGTVKKDKKGWKFERTQ